MRYKLAIVAGLGCLPDLVASATPPLAVCGEGTIDFDQGEECDPGSDAGVPGCTASCLIDCDGGFVDPKTNHCYFFLDPHASQIQAREDCVKTSAHLVTFVGLNELLTVTSLADTDAGTWMLMQRTSDTPTYASTPSIDEPGWSPSCSGCFAYGIQDGGDLPQVADAGGECLFASKSAALPWLRVSCTQPPLGTLCEREPPGNSTHTCDGGVCVSIRPTYGEKTYLAVVTKMTFDQAAFACVQVAKRLVVFETAEEREALAKEIFPVLGNEWWIGLSLKKDGVWRWENSNPTTFYPLEWGADEPAPGSVHAFVRSGVLYDTSLVHTTADL